MSLKAGQQLGQYRIIEQIGKGGMATVFRASQPSLSREVAIKVLPEFFADDPAFHARFRQEAMSIAKLRHPNILTVFDSGDADGVAYIVTELVDGGTLADKLGTPLPLDYCVTIATAAGQALDYAHARGMIHRDVKPSNILLATDGTPILSDFGLARMTGAAGSDSGARLTATGTALGTPEYMAPEQVASSNVGPPADIYALAVTLYEMLTGSVPFTGDTPIQVIAARLRDPLPLPRSRNPALSVAVQDVLLKGLAEEPSDRFASAGDMARALDSAVRGTVATAPPPSAATSSAPGENVQKAARKRPVGVFAAAGALVVAGALFLLWWRPTSSATKSSGPPPAQFAASPSTAVPSGAAADASVPAPSPQAFANAPTAKSTGAKQTPVNGTTATNPAPAASRTVTADKTNRGNTTGDGLPPHGRLLYSLSTSASEIAAIPLRRTGDSVLLKSGALELKAGTDTGVTVRLPVDGVRDFVAVLRYVVIEQHPSLVFRFHVTPQNRGHAVRIPAWLHLSAPNGGARDEAPPPCCRPFDVFQAPQVPGLRSLVSGSEPVSVPAAENEEQVMVVSATGPLIVVSSGGQEIARVVDSTFGPGAMNFGVMRGRPESSAALRLVSLELYDAPTTAKAAPSETAELPPHGKLLFAMADHLADIAQTPQQRAENTIVVRGKSLEFTAGSEVTLQAALQVGGISDFVAVMRFAALNLKPFLQVRFHRAPPSDHVVQIPAYLRLAPPEAGARAVGTHACCGDFDVYSFPMNSQPMLFTGAQLRAVASPPNEERLVVLVVKGPLVIVYEDGQELTRVALDSSRPGGMSLQIQARGHQVPAVLRLDTFEIYEVSTAR